jgi:phospholipid-binding lipoprotein MlaA
MLAVTGCANDSHKDDSPSGDDFEDDAFVEDHAANVDPWEPMNRGIYAFNDFADRWVLLPVATGYQWITPAPVESGVSNFYANLFEIRNIVNDLLQLKFVQAGSDASRFVVNTTLGLLGFVDAASYIGLEKNNEDFGQTLGYWGAPSGPYIVVPLFGPRTIRSGTGSLVDTFTDPVFYIDDNTLKYSLLGLRYTSDRAGLIQAEKLITGDRYTFIRDSYLQRREFLVNDGVVEDSFGNEDEDWGEEWE